jgi:WD40 repeat protein
VAPSDQVKCQSLAWHPTRSLLAAAWEKIGVTVYDRSSGKWLRAPIKDADTNRRSLTDVSWSPSGEMLAASAPWTGIIICNEELDHATEMNFGTSGVMGLNGSTTHHWCSRVGIVASMCVIA